MSDTKRQFSVTKSLHLKNWTELKCWFIRILERKVHNPVSPQGNSNSRKIKVLRDFFCSFSKMKNRKVCADLFFRREMVNFKNAWKKFILKLSIKWNPCYSFISVWQWLFLPWLLRYLTRMWFLILSRWCVGTDILCFVHRHLSPVTWQELIKTILYLM